MTLFNPSFYQNDQEAIFTFLCQIFSSIGLTPQHILLLSKDEWYPLYQDILHRIEQLNHDMQKDQFTADERFVGRILGDTTLALINEYKHTTARCLAPSQKTATLLQHYPFLPNFSLDQGIPTWISIEKLVQEITHATPRKGKVLFLGDRGGDSLLLADQFEGDIHVIGTQLHAFEKLREQNPRIKIHVHDILFHGIPNQHYQQFDSVALSPSWDVHGAWNTLSKAIFCLKRAKHSRIFLIWNPRRMENKKQTFMKMQRKWRKSGMSLLHQKRSFNFFHIESTGLIHFANEIQKKRPSPLFDSLCKIPFVSADLFVLSPDLNASVLPIRNWLFYWWHGTS